jgi:hypothetical protein
MAHFADDCVLEMPRGPNPWGARSEGKTAVRKSPRGPSLPRSGKAWLFCAFCPSGGLERADRVLRQAAVEIVDDARELKKLEAEARRPTEGTGTGGLIDLARRRNAMLAMEPFFATLNDDQLAELIFLTATTA